MGTRMLPRTPGALTPRAAAAANGRQESLHRPRRPDDRHRRDLHRDLSPAFADLVAQASGEDLASSRVSKSACTIGGGGLRFGFFVMPPRLIPVRTGTPELRSAMPRCISTPQCTASTALANSASTPYPAVLTMRP
jgi:hypothetical protein